MRPGDVIAIHAGAALDRDGWHHAEAVLREHPRIPVLPPWPLGGPGTPYRAILGVVTLEEVRTSPRPGDPWWVGPVGWYFRDPTPLPEPLPVRGAQGLWPLPPQTERHLRDLMRRAVRINADLRKLADIQAVIDGHGSLKDARETAGLTLTQASTVTGLRRNRLEELEQGAAATHEERAVLCTAYAVESWR